MDTLFKRRIHVPPSIVKGKASVACPYCGADACALRFPFGHSHVADWRCSACERFGQITRDHGRESKQHINLEIAPEAKP